MGRTDAETGLRPVCHLSPVALAPFHALVQKRPAHGRIADEVTGSQHDALVRIQLDIAVLALGDKAGHITIVVLRKHDACCLEQPVSAVLLGVLDDVLVHILDVVALIAVELGIAGPRLVTATGDGVLDVRAAPSGLRVAQRVLEHVGHIEGALILGWNAVDDDHGILHVHRAVVLLALGLVGIVDLLVAVEHGPGVLHVVA